MKNQRLERRFGVGDRAVIVRIVEVKAVNNWGYQLNGFGEWWFADEWLEPAMEQAEPEPTDPLSKAVLAAENLAEALRKMRDDRDDKETGA